MTHTIACGKSKAKRNMCKCSCDGVHHGELRVEDFRKKVSTVLDPSGMIYEDFRKKVIVPKMSPGLYRKIFGDRKNE